MKNLEIVKSVVKKFLGSARHLLLKKAILSIKDTCVTILTKVKKKIASLRIFKYK
jgi:hypothetical protein